MTIITRSHGGASNAQLATSLIKEQLNITSAILREFNGMLRLEQLYMLAQLHDDSAVIVAYVARDPFLCEHLMDYDLNNYAFQLTANNATCV